MELDARRGMPGPPPGGHRLAHQGRDAGGAQQYMCFTAKRVNKFLSPQRGGESTTRSGRRSGRVPAVPGATGQGRVGGSSLERRL